MTQDTGLELKYLKATIYTFMSLNIQGANNFQGGENTARPLNYNCENYCYKGIQLMYMLHMYIQLLMYVPYSLNNSRVKFLLISCILKI